MKLEGLNRLVTKLQAMAAKRVGNTPSPSVLVGFTAAYALFVHENMEIWPPGMRLKGLPRGVGLYRKGGVVYVSESILTSGKAKTSGGHRGFYWDPQGKAQPKFLEGPARELSNDRTLQKIILESVKAGKTLAQALLTAGLRLQREAQLRVPVETGNLKNSAFTRLEV
jgi:hypothetical protein